MSRRADQPIRRICLVFGADASQLELEESQRQKNRKSEAHNPRNMRQRQVAEDWDVLRNEQDNNESEDRADFAHTNEHGLPFNKPHWPDACRCEVARGPNSLANQLLTRNSKRFHEFS